MFLENVISFTLSDLKNVLMLKYNHLLNKLHNVILFYNNLEAFIYNQISIADRIIYYTHSISGSLWSRKLNSRRFHKLLSASS